MKQQIIKINENMSSDEKKRVRENNRNVAYKELEKYKLNHFINNDQYIHKKVVKKRILKIFKDKCLNEDL